MLNLLAITSGGVIGIVVGIVVVVLLIILASCIRIVRQSTSVIVERLGKYSKTWETGFHMLAPFIERASAPISLKEIVADFKPQPVITKDNVTMQIDTVVYFQVTDSRLFAYGVERPLSAIENLTATTLRNIVGELELDETLTSRDTVNYKMREVLDKATDPWGIKITRVELKNILPPKDIQNAMEKQMRAERERRESILQAEGEKASKILIAEGEKQSKILKAEGDKQVVILAAEAQKEAYVAEAQGKAQAIEMINKANPNAAYVTLEGYQTLAKVADGQATKIIVPSDIQDIAGLFTSVAETLKDPKAKAKDEKAAK